MKKLLKKNLILRRIKDGLYATKNFNKKYYQILKWTLNSREDTNYTYDLTDQNLDELYKLLESIFNIKYLQAEKYSNKLLNFCIKNNRSFVLFKERPKSHWYLGAGIAISYTKK